MALTFPRALTAEMFLNGQWRDLSADVRQSPPVTITYGRKDESSKPTPARCTFSLDDGPDHGNGDYNPLNPMGQWYEYLSRNTPVRVCLPYGTDSYTRTSASGWGTSPDMGSWSTFTSAGTVASDISANQGRHQITSTNAFIASYLPAVAVKNVDTYVEFAFDTAVTVSGGNLEVANLLLRGQNTTTYYMLRVEITTAQAITLTLMVGSSQTLSGPVTVGTFWGTTAPMSIRFQADGNTFRGKVWRTSDGEPLAWGLEYSHGDVYGAGWVGIRSGVSAANTNTKPVKFLYDNYTVRIPRFSGEVAKMVPVTEPNHTNQRTDVECGGVLRRIQRGKKVLDTAFQRWATTQSLFDIVEYYPLDEDANASDRGISPLTGKVAQFATTGVSGGGVKWGEEVKRGSLDRGVLLTQGGILSLDVASKPGVAEYGTDISFTWTYNQAADSDSVCYMFLTNGDFITVDMNPGGNFVVTYFPVTGGSTVVISQNPTVWVNDDNQWINCGLSIANNTGTGIATWVFSIGTVTGKNPRAGAIVYTNTTSLRSGQPQSWVFIAADSDSKNKIVVAQAATWNNALLYDPGSGSLVAYVDGALNGWSGEPSELRFTRLLIEEGISWGAIGYAVDTPAMGDQSRDALVPLLQEAADVAQAAVFEARASNALVFRNVKSTVNQTPALTLDYANHEVAVPFRPITDDQGILNDVTAKRPLGAEYRYHRSSGPLNDQDPGDDPEAVGTYDATVTVNVEADSQLADAASWRVAAGTLPGPRFAALTVDLAASAVAGTKDVKALDVWIGDQITVTNMDAARIYDDVRLIVWGYTETFDTAFRHLITFNTTPADVFDGFVLDSATYGRLDSGTTTLNEDLTTTETGADVTVTDSGDLWSSTAVPYDVIISGERCTVTAVSGTTSPQTLTLTRSVNGVVKTQLTGAQVHLFRPTRLVLS